MKKSPRLTFRCLPCGRPLCQISLLLLWAGAVKEEVCEECMQWYRAAIEGKRKEEAS